MDSEAKSAGIGILIFLGIMMAIALFSYTFNEPRPTSNTKTPTKQNVDSEYQDAMESKNYNPNSEGGEKCYGQICN